VNKEHTLDSKQDKRAEHKVARNTGNSPCASKTQEKKEHECRQKKSTNNETKNKKWSTERLTFRLDSPQPEMENSFAASLF